MLLLQLDHSLNAIFRLGNLNQWNDRGWNLLIGHDIVRNLVVNILKHYEIHRTIKIECTD